jgi:hypothetical protein
MSGGMGVPDGGLGRVPDDVLGDASMASIVGHFPLPLEGDSRLATRKLQEKI